MAHKTVWLIRHGQTLGNEQKRYNGRGTDEPLSEEGIRQARLAGKWIGQIMASAGASLRVCASPLKRAVQTADLLFANPKIRQIEDLEEMDFGAFEGKSYEDLSGNPAYQAWIDSGGTLSFPGGETKEEFTRRCYRGFLTALGDPDREEMVAVVCHGGTIMAVMHALTGKDYYEFMTCNLGGYCLETETDDEGIHSFTYHGFDSGDPG